MTSTRQTAFDEAREVEELRAYLGAGYDQRRLERYDDQLEREFEATGDEAAFYRTSEAYLYNLTAFALTRTKQPYLAELRRAVCPGARVLDYGCGIGSDGLQLIEEGYRVSFADFDNPSTRYLRWRLERRGLEAEVHDLDSRPPPDGFDLVFAFDVIEHVDDPFAFLGQLEARARLVLVNFLDEVPGETALHRKLPLARLLRHAAGRGLRSYSVHHERSHLVLYAPERAGPLARVRNRLRLARARGSG